MFNKNKRGVTNRYTHPYTPFDFAICDQDRVDIKKAISDIDPINIFPIMISCIEKTIHWALANDIAVMDASIMVVAHSRKVLADIESDRWHIDDSTTINIMETATVSYKTCLKDGIGEPKPTVAYMCCLLSWATAHVVGKRSLTHDEYFDFMIKYAYLMGTDETIEFIRRQQSEALC